MYILKDPKRLTEFGFKEYKDGYSKKMLIGFLDITFQDLIVKKVHFEDGLFVYEIETGENINDLIKAGIVKEYEEET